MVFKRPKKGPKRSKYVSDLNLKFFPFGNDEEEKINDYKEPIIKEEEEDEESSLPNLSPLEASDTKMMGI